MSPEQFESEMAKLTRFKESLPTKQKAFVMWSVRGVLSWLEEAKAELHDVQHEINLVNANFNGFLVARVARRAGLGKSDDFEEILKQKALARFFKAFPTKTADDEDFVVALQEFLAVEAAATEAFKLAELQRKAAEIEKWGALVEEMDGLEEFRAREKNKESSWLARESFLSLPSIRYGTGGNNYF